MSSSGGQYPSAITPGVTDANSAAPPVVARVQVEDFNGGTWSNASAGSQDGGTPAKTLAAIVGAMTSTSAYDRLRTPNVFKQGGFTVVGPSTLWTPAAGKKFRLMGFVMTVGNNVAQAAGGNFAVRLMDSGNDIGLICNFNVPAVAVTTPGSTVVPANLGNGILSVAANNVLQVDLVTAALTAGEIRVIAYGTEE